MTGALGGKAQSLTLNASPDANGIAFVTLPQLTLAQRWTVEQITVFGTSTNPTTAAVYVNGQFWAGTISGNFDTATGLPYLVITGKDTVSIQWTGCSQNDSTGQPTLQTATLFYE